MKVRGQKSKAKIKAILVRWKRTKTVGKEFYFSEIYKQWWCKKRHPIKKTLTVSQTTASNEVTEQQTYNIMPFLKLVSAK